MAWEVAQSAQSHTDTYSMGRYDPRDRKTKMPFTCESMINCGHEIPEDTYAALSDWRDERDNDDLYIVRSECAKGYEVLQRYGNYFVIRDKRDDTGRRQ